MPPEAPDKRVYIERSLTAKRLTICLSGGNILSRLPLCFGAGRETVLRGGFCFS